MASDMDPRFSSFETIIGPLGYQFLAHDALSREALSRFSKGVHPIPFSGCPDRTLHLLEFHPSRDEWAQIRQCSLPTRLIDRLPIEIPTQGWMLMDDFAGGSCWHHDQAPVSLWTFGLVEPEYEPAFQLPWALLLQDIVRLGGALVHGGLAVLGASAHLFTAPPGGGKTTALARLPSPWSVLSDDAALIWPAGDHSFLASPLPTWGVLTGRSEPLPAIVRCRIGQSTELSGAVILEKSGSESFAALSPVDAAPHLYRACCEHPTVVGVRHRHRRHLFRLACQLARAVPTWHLRLTRSTDYWLLLTQAIDPG
jgi:hypothetical protein